MMLSSLSPAVALVLGAAKTLVLMLLLLGVVVVDSLGCPPASPRIFAKCCLYLSHTSHPLEASLVAAANKWDTMLASSSAGTGITVGPLFELPPKYVVAEVVSQTLSAGAEVQLGTINGEVDSATLVTSSSPPAPWHNDPTTTPTNAKFDAYSAIAHEIGHILGLADVPRTCASVMRDTLLSGERFDVEPADVQAVINGRLNKDTCTADGSDCDGGSYPVPPPEISRHWEEDEHTLRVATQLSLASGQPTEAELRAELLRRRSHFLHSGLGGSGGAKSSNVPWLVFCPADWVLDVEQYFADFWRIAEGHAIEVIPVDEGYGVGVQRRETISALISNRYALGTAAGVFLVGTANDYYASPRGGVGQPDRDLIPSFQVVPPSELPHMDSDFSEPYLHSDWPYVDVIGSDGVPDIPVCRWPASNVVELLLLALKMQEHNTFRGALPSSYAAAVFACDNDNGVADNEWVTHIAAVVETKLEEARTHTRIVKSEEGTHVAANARLATVAATSDVVFAVAAASDRYYPAGMYDQDHPLDPPFDYGDLTLGSTPVYVALSCDTANYASRQALPGRTVAEDLLFLPGRGASGFIGMSWYMSVQSANQMLFQRIAGAVDSGLGTRSIAHDVFDVVHEVQSLFGNHVSLSTNTKGLAALVDPFTSPKPRVQTFDPEFTYLGAMGLSFSENSVVSTTQGVALHVPFDVYVYIDADFGAIGDPDRNSTDGVRAWEIGLELPPGVVQLDRHLYGDGLNIGAGSNLIVGLGTSLPVGVGVTPLARLRLMLTESAVDVPITFKAAVPSSFVDGAVAVPGWISAVGLTRFGVANLGGSVVVNPAGGPTDTVSPSIAAAVLPAASAGQEVLVVFSEPVSLPELSEVSVWSESPPAALPTVSIVPKFGGWAVSIRLESAVESGTQAVVAFDTVEDLGGNASGPLSTAIADLRAAPRVEISEVFANSAVYGTGALDYVEIRNVEQRGIPLAYWALEVDGELYPLELEAYVMMPGQLGLIVRDRTLFDNWGIPVLAEVPALSVNSPEFAIRLLDDAGRTASELSYSVFPPANWPVLLSNGAMEWTGQYPVNDPAHWESSILQFGTGEFGTPGRPYSGSITQTAPDLVGRGIRIERAYPNPFNPLVAVEFRGGLGVDAELRVYDVRGRIVRTIKLHGTADTDDVQVVSWNGKDDSGVEMASGVYFVSLHSDGNLVEARRVVLIR